MAKKQRVGIFVDGANIIRGLKGKRFHYDDFNKWAAKGRDIGVACYFDSSRGNSKDKTPFVNHLKACGYHVFLKRATLMSETKEYKQVGIDVYLSIKAMRYADEFDVFILVSGDYDFIPLVEEMKQMGKKIEVISFKDCMHPIYRDKFKSRTMDEFIEELHYV